MSGIAVDRLTEERKLWRRDHPRGFYARPSKNKDNSTDLLNWDAGIPGKEGTDWEGGTYKITMEFSKDYPVAAPFCRFNPPIFHPNVWENGEICIDILGDNWRPAITMKQIVLALQDLFTNPNVNSPANRTASNMLEKKPADYSKRIKKQAEKFKPTAEDE